MKNSAKIICVALLAAHMIIISMYSVAVSIESYSELYNKKSLYHSSLYHLAVNLVSKKWVAIYSKYSGAETCYGFYAPNVLSSGYVEIKKGSRQCAFKVANRESYIRYTNLCNVFITEAINRSEKASGVAKGQEPRIYNHGAVHASMDSTYYDLLLKNMSYRFMRKFKTNDTLTVRLKICEYPGLNESRKSIVNNYEPVYVYEKKYFKRP